jgi:hypothetical protein
MRFVKIALVVVLVLIATAALFNVWLDSSDTHKTYYPTPADAERDIVGGANAFDRGWLPDVLKSGATEIREEGQLSPSHVRATFRYTPSFVDSLERQCVHWPPDALAALIGPGHVSCDREIPLHS